MAAFWFYRPRRIVDRITSTFHRHPVMTRVGIQHAVSDVAVLTESDPHRGVWCSPVSRVQTPDAVIQIEIPDAFLTTWLISRWGVRYSWMRVVPQSMVSYPCTECRSYLNGECIGVSGVELISRLIGDAQSEGIEILETNALSLLGRVQSVEELHELLTVSQLLAN